MRALKRNHFYKISLFCVAIICFSLFLFPSAVKAANAYFFLDSKEINQGDIFVVEVKISNEEDPINVAEATIKFDNSKLEVKELSTGGSIFNLWLKHPTFSNQEGKIEFIGGTPDGFQGEDALALKIIFLAKDFGAAKLDFQDNTSFFLNDGSGTKIGPWLRAANLEIAERLPEVPPKDEWQLLLKEDKTPPEPFEIVFGKDPSIFNNQRFISFFATDADSGVNYFEVKEIGGDFVKAASPYLLKNQSHPHLLLALSYKLSKPEFHSALIW